MRAATNKIIVKTEKEKLSRIIHCLEGSLEKPSVGIVVAVGSAIKSVIVGDKIAFGKHSGYPLKWKDEDYVVLPEEQVAMILDHSDEIILGDHTD